MIGDSDGLREALRAVEDSCSRAAAWLCKTAGPEFHLNPGLLIGLVTLHLAILFLLCLDLPSIHHWWQEDPNDGVGWMLLRVSTSTLVAYAAFILFRKAPAGMREYPGWLIAAALDRLHQRASRLRREIADESAPERLADEAQRLLLAHDALLRGPLSRRIPWPDTIKEAAADPLLQPSAGAADGAEQRDLAPDGIPDALADVAALCRNRARPPTLKASLGFAALIVIIAGAALAYLSLWYYVPVTANQHASWIAIAHALGRFCGLLAIFAAIVFVLRPFPLWHRQRASALVRLADEADDLRRALDSDTPPARPAESLARLRMSQDLLEEDLRPARLKRARCGA